MSDLRFARVCVYAGSSAGRGEAFSTAAAALGTALANGDCELVYGGGGTGLMGAVADATLAAGGRVIGVIPEALAAREKAHRGLSELHVVATMHERKTLMANLADAFIALPGGLGTLEELFEVLTWAQLGIHAKPCGVLNAAGYYDAMLGFLDQLVADGFVKSVHRSMLVANDDADALLRALACTTMPAVPKWLDEDQT